MDDALNQPLLLGFVADLMDVPRIEDAAGRLGYRTEWIERAGQIPEPDGTGEVPERQLAEPLLGREANLIERITRLRPSLIVFDLGNAEIPWREWVALIKSVPATRRYPVVCFGAHVDTDTLRAAQGAGADAVMARSHFFGHLPQVIEQHARRLDRAALEQTCRQPLPAKAIHGLELFNQGAYFEAHEVLEAAWNEDDSLGRDLYRGILQVAVAYLHIERANYPGAVKMFLRMRQWLEPLPAQCRGVEIEQLRQDAAAAYEHLLALGPQGVKQFDRRFFKPVHYTR